MSDKQANITIPVDLTNPGQFFACCGLLELADRFWPASTCRGRFDDRCFHIEADGEGCSFTVLIKNFVESEVTQHDPADSAASPLCLEAPFHLRLDWWHRIVTQGKQSVDLGGGDKLKTWAGKQFGPLIFRLMKSACVDVASDSPFDDAKAVYDVKNGKAKGKTVAPFYFDSRREGTSLDIGFSPDEQDMSVMAYPAVESLALVGLQRFRPRIDDSSRPRSFVYAAWAEPLPPSVAGLVVSGAIRVSTCGHFRFTKPSRGGEYATMFSRANHERNNHE